MRKFSSRSSRILATVDSRLQDLMAEALLVCPIDFGIPTSGGLRTAEQQNELYRKGKSKCDGYQRKSYHQTGKAVDVFAYVDGRASWDKEHLCLIAGTVLTLAKQKNLNIRWGGTFGSKTHQGWDMPHFEIRD